MNARRLFMVLALTLVIGGFGATRGLAYMQERYDGACSRLSGFPGLLQKMHFFAQGTCKVTNNANNCNGACTIQSKTGSSSGRCMVKSGACACVPQ